MNFSYEQLKAYLSQGREVEFYYNNKKYSISNNHDGVYLTEYHNPVHQDFKTDTELLENGKIQGLSIRDIWDDVIIDVLF